MARAELLGRYQALPLPDTTQEAWRFTDLRGFDPDTFAVPNGARVTATQAVSAEELLEIDVSGLATVGEGGIEIRSAPPRASSSRLSTRRTSCSARSSARTTSSRRTTPPSWQNGLLVRDPARASSSSGRCTSGSRARRTRPRSSGGCSSSPRRGAAAR